MEQKKVSGKQLKMVYGLAKKVGIDNDVLHDVAARLCHKDSLSALTSYEASRIIEYLKHINGDDTVPDRASKGQQGLIYSIARAMGWDNDPNRLRGFLEKMTGVSDPRFLTPGQAGKVIEALKHMRDGGRAERRAAT